jgi:hypothetical protein
VKVETPSVVEGGSGHVFSDRKTMWGRHAEERNNIIPAAKILRIIKFLLGSVKGRKNSER